MNEQELLQILKYYREEKVFVHLKCKQCFYNGYIKDFKYGDGKLKEIPTLILIDDRKLGQTVVGFSEILTVDPYKKEVRG